MEQKNTHTQSQNKKETHIFSLIHLHVVVKLEVDAMLTKTNYVGMDG